MLNYVRINQDEKGNMIDQELTELERSIQFPKLPKPIGVNDDGGLKLASIIVIIIAVFGVVLISVMEQYYPKHSDCLNAKTKNY